MGQPYQVGVIWILIALFTVRVFRPWICKRAPSLLDLFINFFLTGAERDGLAHALGEAVNSPCLFSGELMTWKLYTRTYWALERTIKCVRSSRLMSIFGASTEAVRLRHAQSV